MKRSVLWDNVKRVDEKEEKPRAIPWGRGKSGIDMWKYAASPQHCFRLHTHTHYCGGGTHRNKETVSSWHQEPQGGEGVGRKYPLKGYIPRDIYSLRRRLGFQTSSSADGQIITFLMGPPIHTPGSVAVDPWQRKNQGLSGNSLKTTVVGAYDDLWSRKCLAYWLALLAGKTHLTFF